MLGVGWGVLLGVCGKWVGLVWPSWGVWKARLLDKEAEEEGIALRKSQHLLGTYCCGRHSAVSRSFTTL